MSLSNLSRFKDPRAYMIFDGFIILFFRDKEEPCPLTYYSGTD